MHSFRRKAQPVAILMTVLTLLLSIPSQSVMAALVETDAVLDMNRSQDAREIVQKFMARQDVKAAIIGQGVDAMEAQARVNSLTDAEVNQIAGQIEHLPAGGDALSIVVSVLVIVILVLVILKLM